MVRCVSCELDFDQCLKFVYNYDGNRSCSQWVETHGVVSSH